MHIWVLPRGVTAEDMGEGSVLGRPRVLLSYRLESVLQYSGFCRAGHGCTSDMFYLLCCLQSSQSLDGSFGQEGQMSSK